MTVFNDLTSVATAIFKAMQDIFNLYHSSVVLLGVLSLWVIRKVTNIFKHI